MEDYSANIGHVATSDHRRHPRYQIPLPVSVIITDEEAVGTGTASYGEADSCVETVSLQDISLTGLCFTSKRASAVGRILTVQIALGERDYRLQVRVDRSQAIHNREDSSYSIAVLYVRGDEIHPFLAELAAFLRHQTALNADPPVG